MKTAIVIGATGVTGAPLVEALLNQESYTRVLVFSRRKLPVEHQKLDLRIVDFDQIDQWQQEIIGDELFSAMGTTLKQAGSKAAQYRVDYSYQADVIEAAANNRVKRLFLVSAPGANSKSLLFYSRIKGALEDFACKQRFAQRVFFRPSLIVGDRPDGRIGEKLAMQVFQILPGKLPFTKRYQPITGEQLARAMVAYALQDTDALDTIIELDEIFKLL